MTAALESVEFVSMVNVRRVSANVTVGGMVKNAMFQLHVMVLIIVQMIHMVSVTELMNVIVLMDLLVRFKASYNIAFGKLKKCNSL